jgi:hypothetical protein
LWSGGNTGEGPLATGDRLLANTDVDEYKTLTAVDAQVQRIAGGLADHRQRGAVTERQTAILERAVRRQTEAKLSQHLTRLTISRELDLARRPEAHRRPEFHDAGRRLSGSGPLSQRERAEERTACEDTESTAATCGLNEGASQAIKLIGVQGVILPCRQFRDRNVRLV